MVTSNERLGDAPGNVRLPAEASGLDRDSVVDVGQLTSLDKRHLVTRVGRLPAIILHELDAGLGLVLHLPAA